MKSITAALLFTVFLSTAKAQVSINPASTPPAASAMLDVNSSNKGLLIPRVALTGNIDVTTIPSPVASLMVYNTASAGNGGAAVTPGYYYWNGTAWLKLATAGAGSGGAWSLTGNAGNAAANFIGTTDNQPIKFRVNNTAAGELNFSTGNVAFGSKALPVNTSGYGNVAIGAATLSVCPSCKFNVAVGDSALQSQITNAGDIYMNTAVGSKAMQFNTTGNSNTASGAWSLQNNLTGNNNTASGALSMLYNSTGNNNTAFGSYSLVGNLSGHENTSIGYRTLLSNKTGYSNVAIGTYALYKNADGHNLVAIGDSALFSQTTKNSDGVDGSIAIGSKAQWYRPRSRSKNCRLYQGNAATYIYGHPAGY